MTDRSEEEKQQHELAEDESLQSEAGIQSDLDDLNELVNSQTEQSLEEEQAEDWPLEEAGQASDEELQEQPPEVMAMELMALAVRENEAPEDVTGEASASDNSTAEDTVKSDASDHEPLEARQRIDPESLTEDDWQGYSAERLKPVLEAAVFANGKPLSLDRMLDLFDEQARPSRKALRVCLQQLSDDYRGRGIELAEVKSGYRFQTTSDSTGYLQRLWEEKPQRYSRALLETLALVAYRQPITRGEIEDVRGVSVSSHIIKTLQEREWVRVVGHRDVPGRPAMYATTREFLDYFNLSSLQELPSLSEIKDLDHMLPGLDLGQGDQIEAESSDDQQPGSESSFDSMIQKLKEEEAEQEASYIDDELNEELAEMDQVNRNFEQMLEEQRAKLREEEEQAQAEQEQAEQQEAADTAVQSLADESTTPSSLFGQSSDNTESDLSEEDKIAIIQKKLAEQQALLESQKEETPDSENNADD